ncbi:MAG: hypothetical protein ACLSF2_10755 [Butyricicoccus sp.]
MKRYLAAAMLLLALSGCGSSGSSTQLYTTTEDFFAMDTYMSVDVSSEKSESAAEDMAVKIEQRVNQLDAALAHAAGGRSLQAESRERSADRGER